MKKILCIILVIVFCLSSCEKDNKNTQEPPETTPITVPSFDYDFDTDFDTETKNETRPTQSKTVYVSKSSKKVHSIPNCSGMKYYYTMTYSEAVKKGYAFCKNCN